MSGDHRKDHADHREIIANKMAKKECGAKTKSGKPCKNAPLKGRERCRLHGGATPIGPANANYKHGRYSKFVRGDLLTRLQEVEKDPQYLSLQDELNLLTLRITILLETLDGLGHISAEALVKKYDELYEAFEARDAAKTADALKELGELVKGAATKENAWNRLEDTIDLKRRVAADQTKNALNLKSMVAGDELVGLAFGLLNVILETSKDMITDGELRKRFNSRVGREFYNELRQNYQGRLGAGIEASDETLTLELD